MSFLDFLENALFLLLLKKKSQRDKKILNRSSPSGVLLVPALHESSVNSQSIVISF